MFVGVLRLTLHLPEPGSLKSKRHLLRSAIDRVKARYNVSIAEVEDNDLWQRSVVGVAAVGNDQVLIGAHLATSGATRSSGEAYLFSVSGTALATFTNPTPAINDYFGYAVASVGSHHVLIGSPGDPFDLNESGIAYLFTTDGAGVTAITSPTPAGSDAFGYAVAAVGTERGIHAPGEPYHHRRYAQDCAGRADCVTLGIRHSQALCLT